MEEDEGAVFDPELRMLARLVEARCHVAGDLIEVDRGVWAIHGSIPVGGEVIMAKFSLRDEAASVLDRLGPNQP